MFFSSRNFWALVNFWKMYSNTSTFELRYVLGNPPPRFIMSILSSVSFVRESSTSSMISHSEVFWDFLCKWIPNLSIRGLSFISWIISFTFIDGNPYTKYFPVPTRCSWNFILMLRLIFVSVCFIVSRILVKSTSLSTTKFLIPVSSVSFNSSIDSACVKKDIFDLSSISSISSFA